MKPLVTRTQAKVVVEQVEDSVLVKVLSFKLTPAICWRASANADCAIFAIKASAHEVPSLIRAPCGGSVSTTRKIHIAHFPRAFGRDFAFTPAEIAYCVDDRLGFYAQQVSASVRTGIVCTTIGHSIGYLLEKTPRDYHRHARTVEGLPCDLPSGKDKIWFKINIRNSMQTPEHPMASIAAQLCERVPVLPGRLDYALLPAANSKSALERPQDSGTAPDGEIYVCVDEDLVYARFFADFGPLNLGQTMRFCQIMDEKLRAGALVVLYSSDHPHKRANAMTLLALYLVIQQKYKPEDAVRVFQSLRPAFGFRDAACGLCTFFITVFDCARAVYKAIESSIWSAASFSLKAYEHLDQLQHGDINWVVPGKLLAFSGPQRERVTLDDGRTTLLAHEYARVFNQLGVSCVVRFNEPSTYDRKAFLHAGIRHIDLEYPDGGNPSDTILYQFLRTCERETGALAVHCKAGLGRTGTHIAAYLMQTHAFSAREAIAWCRICRPGSIVGAQQHFLVVKERELRSSSSADPTMAHMEPPRVKVPSEISKRRLPSTAACSSSRLGPLTRCQQPRQAMRNGSSHTRRSSHSGLQQR